MNLQADDNLNDFPYIELTEEEMEHMNTLGKTCRYCNYDWGVGGAKIFDE